MPRDSAGLLLYRRRTSAVDVLLVHPGGPFWRTKDQGAWSIPKGEIDASEEPLAAAVRELKEETGLSIDGPFLSLGQVRQKGGKIVHAWAVAADVDPSTIVSGTFTMEWPPRSGRMQTFPEVDRAEWFTLDEARRRILSGQVALLDTLAERLQQQPGRLDC